MTSKQRAFLRKLASNIPAIFQLGKNGITDVFINELNNAIEARELIKIHVLENSDEDVKEAAREIASRTNSEIVQVMGGKITLFRKRKEKSKIDLP